MATKCYLLFLLLLQVKILDVPPRFSRTLQDLGHLVYPPFSATASSVADVMFIHVLLIHQHFSEQLAEEISPEPLHWNLINDLRMK
jgi:hypothetical protein